MTTDVFPEENVNRADRLPEESSLFLSRLITAHNPVSAEIITDHFGELKLAMFHEIARCL